MKKLNSVFLLLLVALLSCSKDDGKAAQEETTLPSVKISDVVVNRKSTESVARFYVNLSTASGKTVSVKYTTIAGTAKELTDFSPKSGTITFQPEGKEATVDIPVTGNNLRQGSQSFTVRLSDPENCTINGGTGTATIINDGTYLPTDNTGYSTPDNYAGYHLVWSDEFNGGQLDEKYWNYEKGTGSNGWGNNELEYYTSRPQNIFLSSGNLVIEARKEDYNSSQYTSARITTQGKKEFTYGRIDIRAKLPVAKGMWPALWMLGNNISSVGWPQCGETDIMELIGKNPSQVIGSLHWKKLDGSEGTYNNAYTLPSGNFSQEFHVFSLLWSADSLRILIDNIPYVKASKAHDLADGIYPFDNPSFFIFNVAVGGNWPGPPDNTTTFPQRMFVDYIRVFQKN